jgi:translocation and assembly module TamB
MVLAGVVLVPLGLAAALPWALATPPAQRWILAGANKVLAPGGGRIAWSSLGLSWFGPTRLTGVVLRDAQGDVLVNAPRASLDRSLIQLLFDRPRFGTLRLERAALDIEHRPDGTIDLYETIKPLILYNPRTTLRLNIERGRLRFRSPLLAEPAEAEQADVALALGPAPAPLTWNVELKRSLLLDNQDQATLAITGRLTRWWERPPVREPKDLEFKLTGRRWPWAVAFEDFGVAARGVLDGTLDLTQLSGRWQSSGEAALGEFDASGPVLAGDHLQLERLTASWDLAQTAESSATGADAGDTGRGMARGWLVRRLDLDAPILALKTAGPLPAPPGGSTRIEGTLDLAALARQIPHALRLREGTTLDRGTVRLEATARAEDQPDGPADIWEVEAKVSDLLAHDAGRPFTLESPATLAARVEYQQGTWSLERLALRTAFLEVTGVGSLASEIAWTGWLDLEGLQRQLRPLIDFGGLELAGRGDLVGEYRRQGTSFAGHMKAALHNLRIDGLNAGTLARDLVDLDASVNGPAGSEGLPRGWDRLQLGLTSGTFTAALAASPREAVLTAGGPFTLPQRKGRLEGRLAAHWQGSDTTIDQARLAFLPETQESEPIAIAAEGHFDRAHGELVLKPQPADARTDQAIALGPDGLRISGIGKAGGLRVEGALAGDLAAVGRLASSWGLMARNHDLNGPWSAHASLRPADDGWLVAAKLDIRELYHPPDDRARLRSPGAVRISLDATYQPQRARLDLAELVLISRYARLQASGRLTDLKGTQRADLIGTLTPDFAAINRLLAEMVEPGARLAGRPRPFHLQGTLPSAGTGTGAETGDSAAAWLKGLDLELGFDLDQADFFGMTVGPTPLVLRTRAGRLRVDPIDTTLNQGRIHLEPELIVDDPAGAALRLGPESWVADARINDEVSHRVLAFAAPVLDQATRARGRVSVRLKDAVVPLTGGPDKSKRLAVTGSVVFQDAEFVPSPLVDSLIDLTGLARTDQPSLKLNKPVQMTIADRRVYQKGLVIPLWQLSEITMDGWVDFDRNLALKASLPLVPQKLREQNIPVLTELLGSLRITVPIGGTLDEPKINFDAFNQARQDLAKSFLQRNMARGFSGLFQWIFPPPAPDGPAR